MAAILIIDDEPDYCDVVGRFLQTAGHRVSVASSAADVRESLKGAPPDLVLMDVRMPDVSGLELLPQIKTHMQGTPVLVVTALNDYRIADLLYEAGADGFLAKPVRFEDLAEGIDRLLSQPPHSTAQSGTRKAPACRRQTPSAFT